MRQLFSRVLSTIRVRPSRDVLWSIAILAAILATLMYFKVETSMRRHLPNIDGGYYTNIAQHVRDGDGLKTDVSLYHKGYRTFPHPTSVSPLWPLVYGYAARIAPLYGVGVWLPTALYLLALIFAYLWGAALFPRPLFPERFPAFNAGHAAVLVLGMHGDFFRFTSVPYTEGLAYTLVFAALWRSSRLWPRPSLPGGLELGAWLGLIMLARSQLVILAIAALIAFAAAIALVPERRKYLIMLAGCVPAFLVLAGAHYWYIQGFVDDPGPLSLLRFDQNRANQILGSMHMMVETGGPGDFVTDRLLGFVVAFRLSGKHAYFHSYHLFQYALPAAIPFLVILGISAWRKGSLRSWWAWLRSSASPGWLFVILLAIGGFLSLHAIHKAYFHDWNFPRRQGLTALFLFFLSLVFLLRSRRAPAVVLGIFLLCGSTYLGLRKLDDEIDYSQKYAKFTPENYKRDLIGWLDAESVRRGGITVAMSSNGAQRAAHLTHGVHYHWIHKRTTIQDLERLVDTFGIDYLLLGKSSMKYAFREHGEQFARMFKRIGKKNGYAILIPRRSWLKTHPVRAP